MSNKERILQLIGNVPDNFDLQLIEQAEIENDGETISMEILCKELEIRL